MSAESDALARVLVVDDSRLIRELVRDALDGVARLECCDSAEAAIEALAREPADLVLSDLSMEALSGLDLLERVRRTCPETEFILLTAHASVESAVEALRMGAADYLQKPIQPEQLRAVVDRILSHRRLLMENQRLRGALRTVESCRTLMRCLDAGEVYAVALDLLLHAVSGRRGLAIFHRSGIPGSDGVAFRGFEEREALALRRSLIEEKPALQLDALRDAQLGNPPALEEAFRVARVPIARTLAVPLRGGESELGMVWILEDDHPFGAREIDQATLIAGHADLALSNSERFLRAKERAFVDDVTEVYNVRYLLQAMEHEIQRAERFGKPMSVLFLDLDHFKRVNDQHGHLVGSEVLRQLSRVLGECVRQVDTLARYGGDEFTIVLIDTGHEGAVVVAERIRRTVSETIFEGGRDAPIRLTISIGVATFPDHWRSRDGLLDLADKGMYLAKSRGRNRVCSASELE
ncbi:MAG: diguanylate cyclase [Myxococcales bacterium]|nr:diguanylate cyclase [Myxococcales bacterium]MDH5306318.1 diguanylate cyclase [Myxococcales bacterium]MDH5565981.1 diguanylate cyclase [Myxococcales bacterium]